MSITLQIIDENTPISEGPNPLNANFDTIKQHIDDLEDLLNPTNSTVKLTNVATIPANSIESSTITLTADAGDVIIIAPNGGAAVYKVTSDGDIDARKIAVTGTGAEASEFADLNISGALGITGETTLNEALIMTGADARIAKKLDLIVVVDGMIGSGATNPLDISKSQTVLLDYDNGSSALTGVADINLDTTLLIEGQIIRFHCFRKNSTGQRLYNGVVSSEIFAFIDPNGSGFTTISSAVKPEFDPQLSPDNQSYMVVRWTNIGGGNFRLLVLESKNVLGVS